MGTTQHGQMICPSCHTTTPETQKEWRPGCFVGTVDACPKCGRGYEPEDFHLAVEYIDRAFYLLS